MHFVGFSKVAEMLSNPVVEQQELDEKLCREKEDFRYPFTICMVVQTTEKVQEIAAFTLIKKFCDENNVRFSTREYDSNRFEEDRDFIEKLPAYHLYDSPENYSATFYPSDSPIQKIQTTILQIKQNLERKRARKEYWNSKFNQILHFFEGVSMKKKPKLKEPLPQRKPRAEAKVPIEYSATPNTSA